MKKIYPKLESQVTNMDSEKLTFKFIFFLFGFFVSANLCAQDHIKITGEVIDASTQEPLPFATVSFVGKKNIGTTTDLDGKYILESRWGTDSIIASYVGYRSQTIALQPNQTKQTIIFKLESNSKTLKTVEIVAKKKRYRRKNNPAVALIKKVIANKDKNRMEGQDYFEYDKYEKMEFALNNFSDDIFEKRKVLRNFKFLKEYVDTSALNGKPYLPFYIREIASTVYYRKSPKAKKEYRKGVKMTGIEEWVDDQSLSALNDVLYQEVDIYKNNIYIFRQSFLSPINDALGNMFYRYYILDTIQYNGMEVIEMAFMPANKQDMGFKGNLYILNDSSYAIVKAELSFTKQVNINWINDIKIVQEFAKKGAAWVMIKDQIITDFALSQKSMGIFARRTVSYKNQKFNEPRDPSIYKVQGNLVDIPANISHQDNEFWNSVRHEPLSEKEEDIYQMVDTLKSIRPFRNTMHLITAFTSGYINAGKYEIGSLSTFFSYNDVEGFRTRFGGTTTPELWPKVQAEGYVAYGWKDRKVKYSGALTYSLHENFRANPRHFFKFSYVNDVKLVGQKFDFEYDDSFLFSFQRGNTSRMLQLQSFEINYFYDFLNDFSIKLSAISQNHRPLGSLQFNYSSSEFPNGLATVYDLDITNLQAHFRWAPNQKFVQGKNFRHPIYTRAPIFNFYYLKGLKGVLSGDYNYHKFEMDIFKRLFLPPFGYTDVILEGGKVWGTGVPYYLLLLPRANQTFTAQHRNFNMMNYMEFSNDFYLAWNFQHFFKGYILNKVPLLKRLKLREVVSFKGIWGQLSDQNNPDVNPEFIQFLKDDNGLVQTTSLAAKPYMEASVGIGNIFKFARIDFIKRFTYLDNPYVPELFGVRGLGVRFVGGFEF